MTDSEKLDLILEKLSNMETIVQTVADQAKPVIDHIKPTVDALEKSPFGKMIIGRVNRDA